MCSSDLLYVAAKSLKSALAELRANSLTFFARNQDVKIYRQNLCDLVSSGATLAMNGLREVEKIYTSTAVMIGRKKMGDSAKGAILDRLMLRIDAVMKASSYKYVIFNLPEEHLDQVAGIVGGMKSPTVTRLMEKGWVSVQTVVAEDLFWDVFEQLKALGAQGILVTPIEKMTE